MGRLTTRAAITASSQPIPHLVHRYGKTMAVSVVRGGTMDSRDTAISATFPCFTNQTLRGRRRVRLVSTGVGGCCSVRPRRSCCNGTDPGHRSGRLRLLRRRRTVWVQEPVRPHRNDPDRRLWLQRAFAGACIPPGYDDGHGGRFRDDARRRRRSPSAPACTTADGRAVGRRRRRRHPRTPLSSRWHTIVRRVRTVLLRAARCSSAGWTGTGAPTRRQPPSGRSV